jgi:hypothetical protein
VANHAYGVVRHRKIRRRLMRPVGSSFMNDLLPMTAVAGEVL